MNIKETWLTFKSLKEVLNLEKDWLQIVFYAESNADWAHMLDVVDRLRQDYNRKITCICTDRSDMFLQKNVSNVKSFFIGSGTARTILFKLIKAKAFVLTLTDLNVYHLMRSVHPVHYFYIFHALVSTHSCYKSHAFDHYDSVFCTGTYQINEIRMQETVYNLKAKNLIEGGYCRLDKLIREKNKADSSGKEQTTALIAPTWGTSSMIDNGLLDTIIENLTANGVNTILRLHPMTLRYFPALPDKLTKKFFSTNLFRFDSKLDSIDSLLESDVMIADQGGSAIEYALGLEKPVINISTQTKIHNSDFDKIDLPLFEDLIRKECGVIVGSDELNKISDFVYQLADKKLDWSEKLATLRNKHIFNVNKSAQVIAEHINNFTS